MIRLIIIDDDPLVSESLRAILGTDTEIQVLGTGHSGEEAIQLHNRLKPDVLLMDIRMKSMNGIDAARTILSRNPNARILFLTTFSDDEYIIQALKLGAKGYLLKQNYESIAPPSRPSSWASGYSATPSWTGCPN